METLPVTELRPGDVVDLEPLVLRYAPNDPGARVATMCELSTVEEVRLEDVAPMRPAVIYTDSLNIAVARTDTVDVYRRGDGT